MPAETGNAGGSDARPDEPSPWDIARRRVALALIGLGLIALAAHAVLGIVEPGAALMDPLYLLLIAAAAAAVTVRAVLRPQARVAWSLVASAMVLWLAGEIQLAITWTEGAFAPPAGNVVFFATYACAIAALVVLGGRPRPLTSVSFSVVVCILALASLWALLVLGPVLESAGDDRGALTAASYPLLDLVLLTTLVAAISARGWRLDPDIALLAGGFGVLSLAHLVFVVQVAEGSYVLGTVLDTAWPLAALLIALAAWLGGSPPSRPTVFEARPAARAVAAIAILIAIGIVTWDHFSRINSVALLLAAATMVAGVVQLLLLFRDNARERARAQTAEAVLSASARGALDGVISLDAEGRVIEWNEAAEEIFGYSRAEAIGREHGDLTMPEQLHDEQRAAFAELRGGSGERLLDRRIETTALHAGGHTFPVEAAVTRVQEDPPIFTVFVRDISERRQREDENERLAAIVRSVSDAVVSIDLEGRISSWNEGAERLFGHPASAAVGRSAPDLIVDAAGREEFELACETAFAGRSSILETTAAASDGERLRVSIQANAIEGRDGEIVGASAICHDVTERRLREERQRAERDARLWRRRIRQALDDGRMVFWRQPVIDVETGALDHYELLIRMVLGDELIAPGRFLPHAESSELIREIDRWAIDEGVRLAAEMPVAINLSARSLDDPELRERIRAALDDPRVARQLTFEITETAVAGNLEAARSLAGQLAELGCGISIDDFGTGYGSFTYLKHLPISELKIDMEFVRGIAVDAADRRVVESIIAVAGNFDIKTVAEGVEDQRTLDLLRELGVDLAQGYHLGRPAPFPNPPARTARKRRPRRIRDTVSG